MSVAGAGIGRGLLPSETDAALIDQQALELADLFFITYLRHSQQVETAVAPVHLALTPGAHLNRAAELMVFPFKDRADRAFRPGRRIRRTVILQLPD